MINIQESFTRWFIPKKPKSYVNWDNRLDEIKEAYIASFGKNVFEIDDNIEVSINEIKTNIENRFNIPNKTFAEFNKRMGNGIPQAILNYWLIKYLHDYPYINENEFIDNEKIGDKYYNIEKNLFSLERDLEDSLISQYEELFHDFYIFGDNNEGIQYQIGGKRIDLLLEHKTQNQLLAIELKAGIAKYEAFGQISMYLGLLKKEFPQKNIKGVIIAGKIDDSLKYAVTTNENIKIMEYKMELSINEIVLNGN